MSTMFLLLFASCNDDNSFSTSTNNTLLFSIDTLKLDTVFSNIASSQKNFWIYNKSGNGIRISSVQLKDGNQNGFQVNIDGIPLNSTSGYQTHNIEIRKGDSIRVYVKLLAASNYSDKPKRLNDEIVFTLENGIQQNIKLDAFSWDATIMKNVHISSNTTLNASNKPIVISGRLTVDSLATLTIAAGSTIYFQSGAGLYIYGTLISKGTASKNVILRGARLDNMFNYLPYDYVSGQWIGVHLYNSSFNNIINYTDIHSPFDGIIADSSNLSVPKLLLYASTIHNCQGYGLYTANNKIQVYNCQLSNTLKNCLYIDGGNVDINGCTIAQYYPFDSKRGTAILFSSAKNRLDIKCQNTLITGYADNEMIGIRDNDSTKFKYHFANNIIRTPKVATADSIYFTDIIYENVKDTSSTGKKNFIKIDEDNLRYDFHLNRYSSAISKGNTTTIPAEDRDGKIRDNTPDIGAFEYKQE